MNDSENHVDNTDDLDTFETEFFQRPEKEPEKAVEEKEEVTETELETKEDETPEPEAEEEEEEEVEEEAPKPKARKSAKERIDELTAEKYEIRRELEALKRQITESKAPREEVKEEAPKVSIPEGLPDPDATDKDGNPIYQLGEFDPKYIRDLTKFTIAEETKAAKEAQARVEAQMQVEAAQQEIANKWAKNLQEVEKEIPDLRENITHLTEVFKDVEQNYGEYLASVLMDSDYGPQIMNYLSQNIGEAQKIVASGPAAATLAIGRLETRFIKTPVEEEAQPKKTVSKAQTPPASVTRGHGGRFTITPDTDDLDAFEREFFKRK